jgi:alkylhydroperoxidase family enzyme
LVRWLWHDGAEAAGLAPAAAATRLCDALDRIKGLTRVKREILCYVIWLTLSPRSMTAEHLMPLRAAGLSDDQIHDVVQVVCCVSYMNRLADGLGVSLLADREGLAIELFGEPALAAHRAWSP